MNLAVVCQVVPTFNPTAMRLTPEEGGYTHEELDAIIDAVDVATRRRAASP